jgi:hypothetical protein
LECSQLEGYVGSAFVDAASLQDGNIGGSKADGKNHQVRCALGDRGSVTCEGEIFFLEKKNLILHTISKILINQEQNQNYPHLTVSDYFLLVK